MAKVLLAHGDTHQLELAVQALAAEGFEVVATPDGGDAFARYFEEKPDVVVASVNLPVLDGLGFAAMIKSQTPDVPVVLLTSEPPESPEEGILYLQEPLDVEMLRALVPTLRTRPHTSGEIVLQVSEDNREIYNTLVGFQHRGNILSLLDTPGIERLAAIATIEDRQSGDLVIREGDACNGFYLVVDGAVRVTLAERGDEEVARLGSGEFFGEMALLSEQPRSASVWTSGATRLLYFERDAVLELLNDYPGLRELLGGVALKRAEENLWQALAADTDVQRKLSDLLDGLDDADRGRGSVDISVGPPALAPPQAPTPSPPVGPDALVDTTVAAPPAEDRSLPETVLVAPSSQALAGWLATAREMVVRHQFGVGLAVGALVGVSAMVVVTALLDDQDLPPVPPEPPELVDTPVVPPAEPEPVDTAVPTDDLEEGREVEPQPNLDDGSEISPPEPLDEGVSDAATVPGEEDEAAGGEAPAGEAPAGEAPAGEAAGGAGESEDAAAQELPTRPGLDKLEKRPLRTRLLNSYRAGRFEEALACGVELDRRFKLDWEAQFATAQAAREEGFEDLALALYESFADKYPANVYADDARFWQATILAGRGELDTARELFESVASDPKSDLGRQAAKRAADLRHE